MCWYISTSVSSWTPKKCILSVATVEFQLGHDEIFIYQVAGFTALAAGLPCDDLKDASLRAWANRSLRGPQTWAIFGSIPNMNPSEAMHTLGKSDDFPCISTFLCKFGREMYQRQRHLCESCCPGSTDRGVRLPSSMAFQVAASLTLVVVTNSSGSTVVDRNWWVILRIPRMSWTFEKTRVAEKLVDTNVENKL